MKRQMSDAVTCHKHENSRFFDGTRARGKNHEKVAAVLLAALLLAGCGTVQSVSADAQPVQENTTKEKEPLPAATPELTPTPEVSLAEWLCRKD